MQSEEENNKELELSLKKAKPGSGWDYAKRWIPSLIILPIAVYWLLNRGEFSLLDSIDLVIHEAGHFFFSLFGKFIYTLGGTLMQIILPSIIAGYFFRKIIGPEFSSVCSGLDKTSLTSAFMRRVHRQENFLYSEAIKSITIGITFSEKLVYSSTITWLATYSSESQL